MIYVYPPLADNYPGGGQGLAFFNAVRRTARNIVRTVVEHNKNAQTKDIISVIRMTAFSSGIYRGSASQKEVKKAIQDGILEGLKCTQGDKTIKVIQYPKSMDIDGELNNDRYKKNAPSNYIMT